MKYKATLTSLIVTVIMPLSANAQGPIPGEVGNVNFALSISYEEGAFDGEYDSPNNTETKTISKSVVITERLSTKEMIDTLILRYDLSGKTADYSIKYVKSEDFIAYFIVNKDETSIICIGAESVRGSYTTDPIHTYYTTGDYTDSEAKNEVTTTTVKENGDSTTKSSYQSINCGTYIYMNPFYNVVEGSDEFECFSLVTRSGFTTTTTVDEVETVVNRTGATKYADITGTDYEGRTITGSFAITPLKAVDDVNDYKTAFDIFVD